MIDWSTEGLERLKSRQADSDQPHAKGGHPKMFPPVFKEDDSRTSWQKFEDLASKVFSVPKSSIDSHKPVRPYARRSGLNAACLSSKIVF